jgi:(p)ppGpp synthase/HD superfamily hydrolase
MNDLDLARHLAAKYHAGQKYGDDPYTTHLDEVEAAAHAMFPGDERVRILGQLHDILEDTDCTEAILRTLFEKAVVDAVLSMTHKEGETRHEYLIRCRSNELGRKGKLADSFCNLRRSLFRGDMKRVRKYGDTLNVLAT